MPTYDKAELGKMAQEYGFVRDIFEKVLRLKEILRYLNEEKYIERFVRKEYVPELLFDDEANLERIREHPMAIWKCR